MIIHFFIITILLIIILLLLYKCRVIDKQNSDLKTANNHLIKMFDDLGNQLTNHLQE